MAVWLLQNTTLKSDLCFDSCDSALGSNLCLDCCARAGWDDEDEVVAPEAVVVDPYGRLPGAPLAAPVVEGIFGWRWPSTDKHERYNEDWAVS